jgi:cytochrome P450
MLEPFTSLHDFVFYNAKAKEFYEYLSEIIAIKTRNPDNAFIGKFIIANNALDKPLSHSEMISVIAFLFFAGIETSINLFGQSVLLLIENPEQARLLRENPSIAPFAVEELLRYVTPSQYTTPVVTEDLEIGGQQIKAGEFLMGATVSANHDADVFENPEKLDLARKFNPHIAFGYGLHYCLGARLAREEMTISFPALLREFPNISLDSRKKHVWDRIIINRGLKSLPVILN